MSSFESSGIGDLYEGVDMTKVMFGQNAIHIPLNMIVQGYLPDRKVAGVFQTAEGLPLLFNSNRTHVIVLGDAIIRPRLVLATDEMRGYGAGGLFTNGFVDAMDLVGRGLCDVIHGPPDMPTQQG